MFLLYNIVNSILFLCIVSPSWSWEESWPGTEAWVGWCWTLQPHCLEVEKPLVALPPPLPRSHVSSRGPR